MPRAAAAAEKPATESGRFAKAKKAARSAINKAVGRKRSPTQKTPNLPPPAQGIANGALTQPTGALTNGVGDTQILIASNLNQITTAGASVTYATTTWPHWNVNYNVTCGTCSTAGTTWTIWCDTEATNTTMTASTWPQWQIQYINRVARHVAAGRQPTAAEYRRQQDAWAAEQRRFEADVQRRAAEVNAARIRAEDLLRLHLTEEQRRDLDTRDCFYLETISQDGTRRRYRIDRGTHGNVKLLDDKGSIIGSYCVQPHDVPAEDAMLAQKLWIEADEKAFLKVANFFAFDRGHYPAERPRRTLVAAGAPSRAPAGGQHVALPQRQAA